MLKHYCCHFPGSFLIRSDSMSTTNKYHRVYNLGHDPSLLTNIKLENDLSHANQLDKNGKNIKWEKLMSSSLCFQRVVSFIMRRNFFVYFWKTLSINYTAQAPLLYCSYKVITAENRKIIETSTLWSKFMLYCRCWKNVTEVKIKLFYSFTRNNL